MKRRKFLQGLLAVTGVAAIPSPPVSARAVGCLGDAPPAALQRCAFFDYDDNLVMEGKFSPASLRVVFPVLVLKRRRFGKDEPSVPMQVYDDAVFARVGNPRARPIRYEQMSGPRMPRRGYVI